MATYENNALMSYKDEKGDLQLIYPITKIENVVDGVSKNDLTKYLPLTGGTLSGNSLGLSGGVSQIIGTDEVIQSVIYNENRTSYRTLVLSGYTVPKLNSVYLYEDVNGQVTGYIIYGEHNKPSGTYTGNGSATSRTVNIGGVGKLLYITSTAGREVLVGNNGAIVWYYNGQASYLSYNKCQFKNGILIITTDDPAVNNNGATYEYDLL